MKSLIEKTSDKLVNAFLKNKIIKPIPSKFTKKLKEAQKLRILCESKIKHPVIGFKAAGTGIPLIKKFKEKEPFYASVYKRNFLKNGKSVKINKATLGIELEVCYKIKKSFFSSKRSITMKNISKYISHMAPCIEVVGYRQRKKGTMIKSSGSGTVTMAEDDLYYTGGTIIMDHGHGISTIYSHLETVIVSVGDKINQGDIIGTVGSTGRSTGPHLDFRVNWFQTRLDPMSVIN